MTESSHNDRLPGRPEAVSGDRKPGGRSDGFHTVFNHAGAGMVLLDRSGRMLQVNAGMRRRLLYGQDELLGKPVFHLLCEADAGPVERRISRLVNREIGHFRRQLRYVRKDGALLWGDLSVTATFDAAGALDALIGILIDINEQKEAEAALRQSEAYYRRMFDNSGAASIIIEPDMTIVMANEEFEKLTGYSRSDIEGRMKWSSFIASGDRERMVHYHYLRRQFSGQAPSEYECQVVNRWGEQRHIFMKVGMLPDGRRSIASFMDITRLKQTEQALQENTAKLRTIIEAAQGYIYTCSRQLELEFMNKAFMDRIGRDAVGEHCYRVLCGLDAPCPWCRRREVFAGKTARMEFENPADGRWYDAVMSPIVDDNGSVSSIELFAIDITERKQAESALAERAAHLREENVRLKSSMRDRFRFGDIIGKSKPMQTVYDLILNAAATDANTVIYGESGTGKELVARAIHENSRRRGGPFVVVNCGAIPEALLESEFFGYKKGAFTGAERDKHGYLALADGGTLFLDELGEIGLNMQVKLLRVIEGRGYTPVGGQIAVYPDIRIIAATHRNLREQVRAGAMREDFFYRIHVIPVRIPPLRERKEDLLLLLDHFRQHYPDQANLPPITGQILEALHDYEWPGNV
ncbi:MAG TPA: sigma 54-interacting transcriptional regulator, partial [Desulfosalsimonadaceae bacterium]|nr:sigma 54-interacting transcriptional regulator [Desulfosalsimonadaceae bacterium]